MITDTPTKTVLVIGAAGMLGNAVMRVFAQDDTIAVFGSTRSSSLFERFPQSLRRKLIPDVDVQNLDSLIKLFGDVHPDVVINCVGLVKQLADSSDPLAALPINSLLPHRLARLCRISGARLIHVSTDCVFDGVKGSYNEGDKPNSYDLYGRSKLLGEVSDAANAITLRTSIIGHELVSSRGLVEWFLSQRSAGTVKGFTRAIFSGLPTVELARVMRDIVVPNPTLCGLYHVSAEPISKYDLLRLIADVYDVPIRIEPDEQLILDRSLDSTQFRNDTGFRPLPWLDLVRSMHAFG